ncbi:IQ-domain 17 isoform 2 [Hibiscus syriacus]|uniref:IQ-domain 17 isoform 2 n=1 Tax=Hibiscus syriacus TaxID=106335 RepID=A0A6A3BZB2_HIBSY|nr:IQ-domain 17 isoform 2 [Hibiscus syriacus]
MTRKNNRHDQQEDDKKRKSTQQTPVKSVGNGGGATAAATESATLAVERRRCGGAAVTTAQAAEPTYGRDHHFTSIVIQTAFRGYLARRALRSVSRPKKEALAGQKPETGNQRPEYHIGIALSSRLLRQMIISIKEAAMKREKNLSLALSQQMRRARRSPSMGGPEDKLEPKWLDRWMPAKPWDNRGRASAYHREGIKTVEMDTSRPCSYLVPNYGRINSNHYPQRPSSPLHRAQQNAPSHISPITPSPSKSRPIQVRSTSPNFFRDYRSSISSQTPSLSNRVCKGQDQVPECSEEEAEANTRKGPSCLGEEKAIVPVPEPYITDMEYGGYGHSQRSPSFRSVSGSQFGIERQSNYSSCCTDSLGGGCPHLQLVISEGG